MGVPSSRAIAFAVFAVVLCLSVAVPPGTARTEGKSDSNDAEGPLDIARVHLGQSGPNLHLRVQTYGPWAASQLQGNPGLDPRVPQTYLCLEFVQHETRSRSCLTAAGRGRRRLSKLTLDPSGAVQSKGSINAKVKRGGNRSFRASFRFQDVGLGRGRFGWRVISGWGDPSCAPHPPGSPPPPPESPPAPQCTDAVPDGGGFASGKLRRPHVVGCTHGGPLVRSHGGGHGKQVALTFDDGPSGYTSSVIKILDRQGAKGTFFVIGQEIPGRQKVMRRALDHGHEIGNHTMHHRMLPPASDFRATSSAIRRATGFTPCDFRPPGGAINLSVARGARAAGMTTVLWDVDTRDWSGVGSATIKRRATAVRPGSIVLMHDGGGNRSQTVAAVPPIISELKRRGFELVTVSRLLGERMIWRP